MTQVHLFDQSSEAIAIPAGTVLFQQGDQSDVMYILVAGEVELRHGDRELARVAAGTPFGEMAMLEARPHHVTAIAHTDCQVVKINRQRFLFMVEQTPQFALTVMTIMAERLDRMNGLLQS